MRKRRIALMALVAIAALLALNTYLVEHDTDPADADTREGNRERCGSITASTRSAPASTR